MNTDDQPGQGRRQEQWDFSAVVTIVCFVILVAAAAGGLIGTGMARLESWLSKL